jgi:hypothetical protein
MNSRPIPLRPDVGELARGDRQALHRAVTAMALGAAQGRDAAAILKRAWPRDATAELVLRAAVSPDADDELSGVFNDDRVAEPGTAERRAASATSKASVETAHQF